MTIEDCFNYVATDDWSSAPVWPPDAFALCAHVLHKSGAYTTVVSNWPPIGPVAPSEWAEWIHELGLKWRESSVKSGTVPPEIANWWRELVGAKNVSLTELAAETSRGFCEALLQICAAADEACTGIGMPGR